MYPWVPEPGQDFMCHKGFFTQEVFVAPANAFSISVGSVVCEQVRMNESLGRTNRTGSFVSFTIRFTALTPLSLTDSAENRAFHDAIHRYRKLG